jgi:hypothetical protein
MEMWKKDLVGSYLKSYQAFVLRKMNQNKARKSTKIFLFEFCKRKNKIRHTDTFFFFKFKDLSFTQCGRKKL